jgi:hypothetical protein
MELSMETTQTLLGQWRETNRRACEVEAALFDATMSYTSGRGPMPSEELIEEARALRARSKELFEEALEQFSESTRSAFGGLTPHSGPGASH